MRWPVQHVVKMAKKCPSCGVDIKEPFIRCAQCIPVVDICPLCFSKGREFGMHKNNHDYEVKENSFSICDDQWSAAEEVKLLDSLLDVGFGNWAEVSKHLQTKSSSECRRHYLDCYVDNPIVDAHPFTNLSSGPERSRRHEIPFKMSDDPPRPAPMSDIATELAGYMPCRGDFDVEYDNFAETLIKDIEFSDDDDDLSKELKFAAIDIFLSRLKERSFRKKIVRKYGLINQNKDLSASYGKQERMIRDSLRVFLRLQHPEDNEMFIQGLLVQSNLMRQIKSLQAFRKAGLQRKQAANIYKDLYLERRKAKSKQTILSELSCHLDVPLSCQLWLQKQLQANANAKLPSVARNVFPHMMRKPAPPLDLTGMPGAESLSNEEKELCSQLRIPPVQYTNYKNILIKESNSLGFLRLQQARPLIKIDVNKTKRLYDFFTEKGWINTHTE